MKREVALVGAGRMGEFLAGQFPTEVNLVVIDVDAEKAEALAKRAGGKHAVGAEGAAQAEIVVTALPAPKVAEAFEELAKAVKPGALVLNMSTEAVIDEAFKRENPDAHFINAKIVGHAKSMQRGLPGYLILDTEDTAALEQIRTVLPGFAKILSGDISLVPVANKIGSGEGIATAVAVRKKLRESGVPEDWADVVISTVCAGTMRAYVDGDLGEFARKLADKLEQETQD